MKEIRQIKNKSAIKADAKIKESCEKTAVIKIQKVWRGYVTRCKIRKRRLEEMLLIGIFFFFFIKIISDTHIINSVYVYLYLSIFKGMLQPSQEITENVRQAEKVKEERYEKQVKYQELYENLVVEAKERIRKEKSAIIEENIRSEVRNWVNTYFQQTGKIPDLPSAESGGSRIIFSRQVKLVFTLVLRVQHFQICSISAITL